MGFRRRFFSRVSAAPSHSGRGLQSLRSWVAYRRGIGRIIRDGPLFQPEAIPDTAIDLAKIQATDLHVKKRSQQPGWIFVTTDECFPDTVRLGIAEAEESELRSLKANRHVSRDLRLRPGEVLRYSVFAYDVYTALRSVEVFLTEFESGDDRYRIHSAAAATTIETCGVRLRARRSNFEPIKNEQRCAAKAPENNQFRSPDQTDSKTASNEEVCREPKLDARQSRRGEQRQRLASVMSEVGQSIALASEALQGTRTERHRPHNTGVAARGAHRGLLRPDSAKKIPAVTPGHSSDDIANMERWVMRREAIEYMKSRRLQLVQNTVTALFSGACVGFGLYFISDSVAQRFHLGLVTMSLALFAAAATAVTLWLRYRKGLIVWRRVFDGCADATLPALRQSRG